MGFKLDNTYRELPKKFYERVKPVNVPAPELVMLNEKLGEELGLDIENVKKNWRLFAGNNTPEDMYTISQAYAGHQFGNFTMLGDGRAVLLGEIVNPEGERFDIQLKGSGMTPFSRRGDGKATLGPMLREYIISEAMNALNIPTTRSLAVCTTGERIMRDGIQPGAVLTRVASSHIRVGTFQYASQWGDIEDIKALADYTIRRHYPDIEDSDNRYIQFLRSVIKKQAETIAKWQCVGFIHGVMNTDNITISGETIDYGPCAFMDEYDPMTVFSSIDREGRYAYGNQPYMGSWGLARFAETLIPLLHQKKESAIEIAQSCISDYSGIFHGYWMKGMREKLGLNKMEPQDERLVDELLDIMKRYKADFTNTFRGLTLNEFKEGEIFDSQEFSSWYEKYKERLKHEENSKEEQLEIMKRNNPYIIPRNYLVEEALSSAVESGDYGPFNRFLRALRNPFDYSGDNKVYGKIPPESDEVYRTFCGT